MKVCTVRRRFYSTEATGNVTVNVDTEPGFGTPKAAMMQIIECSADPDAFDTTLADRNCAVVFIGPVGDGTATIFIRTATGMMADNQGSSITVRGMFNTSLELCNTARVNYYRCTAAAFINDGMTLTFIAGATPQTNGHLEAIVTFFGGDDLTVGIGTHAVSTLASTTNSYTGFNFQPDAIFFATSINAFQSRIADDFRISYGASTRLPFKQFGCAFHSEFNAPTMDLAAFSSDTSVVNYNTNTGASVATWTLNSIDATGYTISSNAQTPGTTNMLFHLALKSSPTDYALVSLSSATATGNQYTGLGITGFVPKVILGSSTNVTAYDTRQTATPGADCISFFAGSRTADSKYFPGLGTLTSNTASATLTGTGTSFFRMAPGFKIYSLANQLIGTVSTVTSATSITLTANASITQSPTASFVWSDSGQYCLTYGDLDIANVSAVHSRISTSIFSTVNGTTPSIIDQSSLTDFDTRPGFNLNFTTSSGTAKLGWIMAIKDSSSGTNRRRNPT
jgi:hypothetical protein